MCDMELIKLLLPKHPPVLVASSGSTYTKIGMTWRLAWPLHKDGTQGTLEILNKY